MFATETTTTCGLSFAEAVVADSNRASAKPIWRRTDIGKEDFRTFNAGDRLAGKLSSPELRIVAPLWSQRHDYTRIYHQCGETRTLQATTGRTDFSKPRGRLELWPDE